MQGSEIKFEQLHRCLASVLFREGRPHSEVNFQNMGQTKQLVENFTKANVRDYEAWGGIKYLYTRNEIEQRRREQAEASGPATAKKA